MRKILTTALAALMAATSFVSLGVSSADAQPRNWRGNGYDRGYYDGGRRYDDRRYHRRNRSNVGGIVAGSIIGLAAGAAIAGAARSNNSVGYCEQRFRSYDRSSGTYLGYDGLRHACP